MKKKLTKTFNKFSATKHVVILLCKKFKYILHSLQFSYEVTYSFLNWCCYYYSCKTLFIQKNNVPIILQKLPLNGLSKVNLSLSITSKILKDLNQPRFYQVKTFRLKFSIFIIIKFSNFFLNRTEHFSKNFKVV